MNIRTRIAVVGQVVLMLVGLVSPLAVMTTGETIYLETAPVDPRSLLRGDFVILGYTAGQETLSRAMAEEARESGKPVYVTLTTERPARFVAVAFERPSLDEGQVCLIGRVRRQGDQATVDFPQIAQYFVPEGQGRVIQNQLGAGLLAEVKVTDRCNAVLVGIERPDC